MANKLYNFLFGCWHQRTSWPLSVRDGERCEPYVCCLGCGKEFLFSLDSMTIGGEI